MPPPEAGKPSQMDLFYVAWAKESLKATGPAHNDTLQRIMGLNVALIGGGFLIAKGEIIPPGWSVIVLAILVASLAFALYGIAPKGGVVVLNDPDAVADFERSSLSRKQAAVKRSMASLFAALAIAVVGLAYSQFLGQKPAPAMTPGELSPTPAIVSIHVQK